MYVNELFGELFNSGYYRAIFKKQRNDSKSIMKRQLI